MSLNEYKAKKTKLVEDKVEQARKKKFEWQMEKGEGMEALLGSMNTYAGQTQAVFLNPIVLLFIILFANETKIPQNYQIRLSDLRYYFFFTVVVIIPQLVIDVFLLHVLEVTHGYKIYDYFTYCDYRFTIRTKKWVTQNYLDRSIVHCFRSLDALNFCSQFYYIIALTTWGIIFLYLGFTAIIRNAYNPYADPTLVLFGVIVVAITKPTHVLLRFIANKIGLWKISGDDRHVVEMDMINRLDKGVRHKTLVKNLKTNPFRYKFLMVNREWIV